MERRQGNILFSPIEEVQLYTPSIFIFLYLYKYALCVGKPREIFID
jgi:hypothetical protein